MAPELITNATNNITGMYTIFQYVQEVSTSFFPLILFAMFVILFVIFRASSTSNSKPFATASFFTMVLSILFRAMAFIQNKWMYVSITVMGIAMVWLHLENSQN